MLGSRIAPALRELGFGGSTPRFTRTIGETQVTLQFQKSRKSDRTSVWFDINIFVSDPDVQSRIRPATKAGRASAGPLTRLSALVPTVEDMGWHVLAATETDRLGDDLVRA